MNWFSRYPIVQAPMAGAQDSRLTIAVCRAGGIGSLAAAMLSAEKLCSELEAIQAAVDGRPYNINFFAHTPPQVSPQQEDKWRAVLQPYLSELGVSADDAAGGGRKPFDEAALEVVAKYRPPIVSFHFGLPEKMLLEAVKATGAQVWSSATTVEEARWLEAHGADAVIAQGWEAGGHRGMFLTKDLSTQSGTFALLPNIAAAVKIPVIAAGGISNADTVGAAFRLGASAVQVGTAFLLADESAVSPAYRAALQSAQAAETVVTNIFSGGFARGMVNRFIREVGPICEEALPFPNAGALSGLLKRAAEQRGCYDFSSFWAGQNARLAKAGSAAEILADLAVGCPNGKGFE